MSSIFPKYQKIGLFSRGAFNGTTYVKSVISIFDVAVGKSVIQLRTTMNHHNTLFNHFAWWVFAAVKPLPRPRQKLISLVSYVFAEFCIPKFGSKCQIFWFRKVILIFLFCCDCKFEIYYFQIILRHIRNNQHIWNKRVNFASVLEYWTQFLSFLANIDYCLSVKAIILIIKRDIIDLWTGTSES